MPRPSRTRNPKRYDIRKGHEPTQHELDEVHRVTREARRVLPSGLHRIIDVLERIDEPAAQRVRSCIKTAIHLRSERERIDYLKMTRCKSPWCPWCAPEEHHTRVAENCAKLRTISPRRERKTTTAPARPEAQAPAAGDPPRDAPPAAPPLKTRREILQSEDGELRVLHFVGMFPRELHPFIRDHDEGAEAMAEAVKWFVALSYGYAKNDDREPTPQPPREAKGRRRNAPKALQDCWKEMGAILNIHPFGDEGTPYPKWSPHVDVVLAGWRFKGGKVTKLRESWPQLFGDEPGKATDTWRRSIRRAFLKRVPIDIQGFLTTNFWCSIFISRGAGEGRTATSKHRTGGAARHTISYSARPLLNLEHYRVERDQNGEDWLIYEFEGKQGNVRHRSHLAPAVSALWSMRLLFTDGPAGEDSQKEHSNAHRYFGILHGKTYYAACRAVGRQPLPPKKDKLGVKRVKALRRDEGTWRDTRTGEPAPS